MVLVGKRVLVVGSGGREHALVWALARSPEVERIYTTPGNEGMAQLAVKVQVNADDPEALARWAKENRIDLTVVGPEAFLAKGLADTFQNHGLAVFGPTKAAARLESSKVFAKEFMARHRIPTAKFKVFDDYNEAAAYIQSTPGPWVVKADGLAAGKGVVVANNRKEALAAVEAMMVSQRFGQAGNRVVIEEKLDGEELSVMAVTDGREFRMLLPAQDHKRVGDGDQGPNTGGMGAYAPTTLLTPGLKQRIAQEILAPAINGIAAEGAPFVGVLYAGLMITPDGPQVIEFNVRFGDPETQAVLVLIESDLYKLLDAAANGRLQEHPELKWREGAAACVVMASGGYPGDYSSGLPITGLDTLEGDETVIFHAGTRLVDGTWVTNGGRVLNVVGLGKTLADALDQAYRRIETIKFSGAHFRRDIGWRELQRR
ncbi:MAG TPA: phosphoribosylamine--glycine ligase [Firmicutes bacterium]|jgi:phosphoribosylamine--glycine ligase|nr:phosphoribosylamine--glycine ligase [Bacillota bacterium]